MELSVECFEHYSKFAWDAFIYANHKIKRFKIPIILDIDYADFVGYTYANLRKPNRLTLHLYNIVSQCGNQYNRNKIYSMIFIVLCHELMHVEQNMSQIRYKADPAYREELERSTDHDNYVWLKAHKEEIDKIFGFSLDLSYYGDMSFFGTTDFRCTTVEEYYVTTFRNVIFRNDELFSKFYTSVLMKYKNIFIRFNEVTNFLIKSDGEFCDGQTLQEFILVASREAGRYDHYTMHVDLRETSYRDMQDAVAVSITLFNRYINPIISKK